MQQNHLFWENLIPKGEENQALFDPTTIMEHVINGLNRLVAYEGIKEVGSKS